MTINQTEQQKRVAGMVYGLAFGDSWGYITEFLTHSKINPALHPPRNAVVSDDTQMSIYNMVALKQIASSHGNYSPEWQDQLRFDQSLQDHIRLTFANQHALFAVDPDNNRAPGLTCMKALQNFIIQKESRQARTGLEGVTPDNNSKGCGTIMRAPWIGAVPNLTRRTVAILATLQSQTTHGHPASWVSAAAVALLIRDTLNDRPDKYASKVSTLRTHNAELSLNALDILGDLATIKGEPFTEEFRHAATVMRDEFAYLLDTHWVNFVQSPTQQDVSLMFGEGWIADEAFYTAVATASLYCDNPHEGVKRLVWTEGDSDSLGAIGGALLFAGRQTPPQQRAALASYMRSALEPRYEKELSEVVTQLTATH